MKIAYENAGGEIPIGKVYRSGLSQAPLMLSENPQNPRGAVAVRGLASATAYLSLRGNHMDGRDIIPNRDVALSAEELAKFRKWRPALVLMKGGAA